MKTAKKVEIPDEPITFEAYTKLIRHGHNSAQWYAMNYNRNSYQIREKLLQKGYPSDDVQYLKRDGSVTSGNLIDEIIQQVKDELIVDDEASLESIISNQYRAGKGLSVIKTKLYRAGYSKDEIERGLEEYDKHYDLEEDNWDALCKSANKIVISSSYRKLDGFKAKQKLVRSLVSKGFNMSDIYSWINENVDFD